MAPTPGAGPRRHRLVHGEGWAPVPAIPTPACPEESRNARPRPQHPDTPGLPTGQGHSMRRLRGTQPPPPQL